jgi:hypothetical protein
MPVAIVRIVNHQDPTFAPRLGSPVGAVDVGFKEAVRECEKQH